ncbi:MAG: CBS domain-containing protein [Nitrospirota bacterium]|nr:CBS domain-containing protein [Nitrospirota bacterium]MDH5768578.1 CBS domain-containing protein [Nitrospirota bacterium]
MSLKPLMSKIITSLPARATALDAAKFMTDMNVGSVIVVEGNKPVGIVTDRDIMTKVIIEGRNPAKVTIKDIMTSPVITVSVEKSIFDVTKLMNKYRVRRFPVVDAEGNIVGVVTLSDILVFIGQEMKNIATSLKVRLGK